MAMCTIVRHSLAALVVLFSVAALARADDPTGTWKWNYQNTEGRTVKFSLKLKLDGDKLSGTLIGPQYEKAIEDGTYKDGELSFHVTSERDDSKYLQSYKGRQQGDSIQGTVELKFSDRTRSYPWEPKREKP